MSERDYSTCPVCGKKDCKVTDIPSAVPWKNTEQMENRSHSDDAKLYECPSCGHFAVTRADYINATATERDWAERSRAQVSALLREQTIRDLPPHWLRFGMEPYGPLQRGDLVPIDVDELLARWPDTVPERLNRMLCNFARLSPRGGHRMDFDPEDTSLAFAETAEEAAYNLDCLRVGQWVDDESSRHSPQIHVRLTPKGWERFEEITRERSSPDNAVFVAMWYGVDKTVDDEDKTKEEMDRLYNDGIRPGIEDAGYRARRVDSTPHNEWIMNEMLGLIRLAPFVVADFTGHRNGVYFEAGFARGLGKTVIHTCEKDAFEKAHFDTKQLNHILWTTPEELRKTLCDWISGSIGWGPGGSPSPDS